MFPFLIVCVAIGVFGPGYNEGGFDAVQEKGLGPAIVQAWEGRDHSNLSGNFGNP